MYTMTRSDMEVLQTFTKTYPNRPLLTHLNADTSWLISFPYTGGAINKNRKFYHLLIDPWLTGTNIVGFTWIMSFTHAITPAFTSIQEVRHLIMDIERAAATLSPVDDGEPDCVYVTSPLPDHCNEHTLTQLSPGTPLISTVTGTARIKSFEHFNDSVFSIIPEISLACPEELWQDPSLTSSHSLKIPSWLKMGQFPSDGKYPHVHWATIFAWSPSRTALGQPNSVAEAFIYSPHGIRPERLTDISWATNPTKGKLLCNMHGFSPAWSPQPVNLGVQNGYMLSKMLKPKYWIPTYDEEPSYTGFIGWMQSKVQKTLQDVIRSDEATTVEEELMVAGTTVRELQNGETFCLV